LTTTTTRTVPDSQTLAGVPIAGARGDYTLQVHRSASLITLSCEERGLFVSLDPAARNEFGRYMVEAADKLTSSSRSGTPLMSIGSVLGTLPEQGQHCFEIEVVRAPGMDVVLLSCEALGIDGVLQASAARRLGRLLLQT
jgi:hypothetical protein